MVPGQRPRATHVALLATLLVGVAFASLGTFAAPAGGVDQAAFDVAQRAVTAARADVGAGNVVKAAEPAVDPSGPVVTLTVPALSTAVSKTASFKVSWTASPALPSGGFGAYRVEYREPGVDYWLTWQQATTALSATFPGQPGKAYEFRVAAAKSGDPSTVGPWSPVRTAAVPADESAFSYLKTWTRTSVSSAYFGKIRTCGTKGATATFRFKGTKAALIAPRGRALGKVAIYVRSATADGWTSYKLLKTVDLYAKTAKARVATTFGEWDPAVERQVKFLVTGTKNRASTSTKVSLDGLAVYGAPRATSWHYVDVQPETPTVVITEQLQFSASIADCVDQRVTWEVLRYDRFGNAFTEGAGAITADGLYTAPSLPTVVTGEEQRTYYVIAKALANPEKVYGMKRVQVTLGPPPVVDSVSPLTGPVGSTVTFTGSHFASHGAVPQVFFSSLEATVTSYTDATVTAIVPGTGWNGWDESVMVYVAVVSAGQSSNSTSSHIFTVTDILPIAPRIESGGITPYDEADSASPGDEIQITGRGFSAVADDNLIRFGGGVVAAATRFEADAYWEHYGKIWVTVPEGAETGALATQRLDGDGSWYEDNPVLEVRPATVVTAALHPSYRGYFTGPERARNGSWGYEDWLIQGSGFSQLRTDHFQSGSGRVFLDIRRNGVTATITMRVVSDTLAVVDGYRSQNDVVPSAIFDGARPGDVVELRIRGYEAANMFERTSPWFSVPLGERPVYGAVSYLPATDMTYWGAEETIAKGSWLQIYQGYSQPTQVLAAPGLWPGTLPLGENGIMTKLVKLDTLGTYTITNQTTGQSTSLTVADVGEYDTFSIYGDTLIAEGALLRFAGGEVDVPAGALSIDDSPYSGAFQVAVSHTPSEASPWDTTLTDGGHSFSLTIWPYVTKLLKPIRITIPYEPGDRKTTPFLGMWDDESGLYYDFGRSAAVQVDTVNRKLTYVIPAGEYVHPSDYYRRDAVGDAAAADVAVSPDDRTKTADPSGRPFDLAFRKAGAVSSKVATSGSDYDWHPADHPEWGVHVDAITDPAVAGYVSADTAREIRDVAAATWTNLADAGWTEPPAVITLTVRDYGDPGVYQGATTKGVFGQPWVYINSRLAVGAQLDTAVSHEMGHVFQRQLTTNITTKWIDEAVAEWVAYDTLGVAGSDLRPSFEAGCDFPTVQFPNGFWAGYTTEQAYGAGAFIIWLAQTYQKTAVLAIYDNLAYEPGNWYDAAATFAAATGRSLAELTSEFAPAFWLQQFDPVKTFTWSSRGVDTFGAYSGKAVTVEVPANASRGYDVAPTGVFRPTVVGNAMVARAPGMPGGASVDVYWDTATSGQPPVAPVRLGTLTSDVPVLDLGVFDASTGCYRLVAIPPTGGALSVTVIIEAVHVDSVSPTSVPKAGGTQVTVNGCGFGDEKGIVMTGPAIVTGAAVTTWTDTRIVFTMPNMGSETGAQPLTVRPVIGGASNGISLTVY